MLFQNSCEVPLGMTAIVSFLPFFDPERLQPIAPRIANVATIKMILRIIHHSQLLVAINAESRWTTSLISEHLRLLAQHMAVSLWQTGLSSRDLWRLRPPSAAEPHKT